MQQLQKQDCHYVLSKKAVFPLTSECAFLVTSGELIKYCTDVDGSTVIVGHFLPGDFIFSQNFSYFSFYVKAMSASSFKKIEISEINADCISNQIIKLEELLVIKAKRLSPRESYPSEECRLPVFLRWLRKYTLASADNHFSLEVIGAFIGTSRHVVLRHMKIMYRNGKS